MYHVHDAERIANMLGVTDPPEELEQEYERWLVLCHRSGKSGPLGSELLTVLLAINGYHPPDMEDQSKSGVNWRKVPIGQAVFVYDNGVKVCGQFAGIVGAGTLAVKIDDDPLIREFRASDVSIVTSVMDEIEGERYEAEKPAMYQHEFGEYKYGDEVAFGESSGKVVGYDGENDEFYVMVEDDTVAVPSGDLSKA